MPSSVKAVKKILEIAPDQITGPIVELGSGWGTLAFPLASRYPDIQVIGYETSPFPFLFSKGRQILNPQPNLKFYRRDFYQDKFREPGLVVCYLYPGAMKILKSKLEEELRPGTWVISNTFAIPGWKPLKVCELEDMYKTKIYLYRVN